ncbi:gliding motility-associated ABC transporter ATP-binding subunit GldA [Aureitalea marina]|uniref:Gliding motility-associated ABC transporter ATP-binding subunit GldA n=1 Tax=Aureitalea marina TaxID=930804 RepID=A0A2S7KM22_9FLAO|nr:gliding motility-associated ABC transporter ATP-binding subunit GldA [Aureitalea marina]PQB03652.1 gliding motility-associated ABC transporter ATP-binding subunit GldA [Aureitalea marina]
MSIQVEHISKQFGDQVVVNDLNFEIEKGEIVGFLGPNGAGKSTTMKMLTTFWTPSSGKALVNGFSTETQQKQVQKSIGYLPEHNPLYEDMYVREYLEFQARIYHTDRDRIQLVIDQTGLQDQSFKRIGQLSKGYRQRVGLAGALLHDPEVLILDEPTTGLDPNQLMEIRQLIRSVGEKKTVLLSTHIMQEVEAICDRVIIIHQGEIVLDQPMSELRESETQVIEVEFDYRVEEVLLSRMDWVKEAKNVHDFVYQLTVDSGTDMRSRVFDFAQENGLKILELHQKHQSLEKLFVELTSRK